MLDINFIRSNVDLVKQSVKNRNMNLDSDIDEVVAIDAKRRNILKDVETKRNRQNVVSKEIPNMKKNGDDITGLLSEMKGLSDNISALSEELNKLEVSQREILMKIPNIPHESVPIGKDENFNKVIRVVGTPRNFDFKPKAHWDLGTELNILDPNRAAKVSGSRFHFYRGDGAKLERSIVNFFLDTHTQNGYTELLPPFIVNRTSMEGTGQLPKFEEDSYKLFDSNYFLIPTAEVPVTNFHRDEILMESDLPIKYCAYSACFRSEVGSAGRDARGLIRQHQFQKVELVKLVPEDKSYDELESLTNDAEKILQLLGLPYRVVALCTGDLGFCSAKTYDLEVWMPSYNRYVEISSCSNFEAFQARRMSIRYKSDLKGKTKLVHTLNGSGLAVGRTVAAILENCQNADGSISIPEVLVKYFGKDVIKK